MANSRVLLLALAGIILAACGDAVSPSDDAELGVRRFDDPKPDSLHAPSVEASYIVVFRPGVSNPSVVTDDLIRAHGGRLTQRYQRALSGFAATLPMQAVDAIRRNPNVELVEADGIASTTSGPQVQPPSWGLDRIDARGLPLDQIYAYQNDAAGVRVYILDTGIMLNHSEYSGRAGSGWDFVENDADASDCHGHGTHVAGTVAGASVGVAKAATVIAVRVLGCTGGGPWSQVIAGIDWVMANHVKPAVANMSLGGSLNQSVNAAVSNAIAAGITFVISAGNASQDACNFSPASTPGALTAGATTQTDSRASFSNYGPCVDLFAPGTDIYSSVKTGSYESWNGTSMAAPHITGVAALYLATHPAATPAEVTAAILDGATLDQVTDALGSPNRLLFSQIAGAGTLPPLPPPPPPTVDPTTEIRVADLDGSAAAGRGSWTAIVRTLVQDLTGAPAQNVTVYGEWSEGAKGTASCITGDDGWCSIVKEGIKKGSSSARLTVYNLKAPGKVYTEVQNGDPDADSDGTYIVVRRP